MNAKKITVTAIISADINTVWECYNEAQHITKWNFASDDWHCPNATNDLKVGGKYIARMEAKDGSFGFEFTAVYDEIIPLKKTAYTMEDGRKTTTTFENNNGTTIVTTTFDAEGNNPVEIQQAGWQAILNNFKKYTEG